jgi:hypothetical protein
MLPADLCPRLGEYCLCSEGQQASTWALVLEVMLCHPP